MSQERSIPKKTTQASFLFGFPFLTQPHTGGGPSAPPPPPSSPAHPAAAAAARLPAAAVPAAAAAEVEVAVEAGAAASDGLGRRLWETEENRHLGNSGDCKDQVFD